VSEAVIEHDLRPEPVPVGVRRDVDPGFVYCHDLPVDDVPDGCGNNNLTLSDSELCESAEPRVAQRALLGDQILEAHAVLFYPRGGSFNQHSPCQLPQEGPIGGRRIECVLVHHLKDPLPRRFRVR
jgi:hypothetical protein